VREELLLRRPAQGGPREQQEPLLVAPGWIQPLALEQQAPWPVQAEP
jgi:hypothetical protein